MENQDILYSKMCKDYSQVMMERILEESSNPLPKSVTPTLQYLDLRDGGKAEWFTLKAEELSVGESTILNFMERPKNEKESHLSQILIPTPPQKYFLKKSQCQCLLNQATREGKQLPTLLQEAIMEVIVSETERSTT